MNKTIGVTRFFDGFLDHLKEKRRTIAPLQLSGRLEDYLVHEFIAHITSASEGNRFAFTNMGNSGEQKFDIGIVSRDCCIRGLVEAKYLRNRHRLWGGDAEDEIVTTLQSLKKQLSTSIGKQHAGYTVKLSSPRKEVYGLVFGSYVCSTNKGDATVQKEKDKFFDKCLSKAGHLGFAYHDLRKPNWRSAFENERVAVLGETRYVSLRVGFWRLLKKS